MLSRPRNAASCNALKPSDYHSSTCTVWDMVSVLIRRYAERIVEMNMTYVSLVDVRTAAEQELDALVVAVLGCHHERAVAFVLAVRKLTQSTYVIIIDTHLRLWSNRAQELTSVSLTRAPLASSSSSILTSPADAASIVHAPHTSPAYCLCLLPHTAPPSSSSTCEEVLNAGHAHWPSSLQF